MASLFGFNFGKKKTKTSGQTRATGAVSVKEETFGTERLKLSKEATDKIIQDVLGGAQGLASIFQEEQVAGIFKGSSAALAAGDLASKLVGELAKLTAERVSRTQTTGIERQEFEEETVGEVSGTEFGFSILGNGGA